jgi:hypothetical protein
MGLRFSARLNAEPFPVVVDLPVSGGVGRKPLGLKHSAQEYEFSPVGTVAFYLEF